MAFSKTNFILFTITLISNLLLSFSRKQHLLDLPEDSYKLIDLDKENFASYIKQEHFFVFIHNSWCSWSQKMEKILTKVNLYLKLEPQPFYIGVFDNSIENIEDSIPEIKEDKANYPILLYFKNGKFEEKYLGRHSFNQVNFWIKKRIYNYEPYVISSLDSFDYKVKSIKKSIVYYATKEELPYLFKKEESLEEESNTNTNKDIDNAISSNYINFKQASKSKACENIIFFTLTKEDLLEKYNIQNKLMMSYFKYGNKTNDYGIPEETVAVSTIEKYCKKISYKNFFSTFDEKAVEEIFIKKQPAIIFFRSVFNNKTEYEELKMETLSYMKSDVMMVITDISTKLSYKLANYFGVDNEMLPTMRIIDFKGKDNSPRKFSLTKELDSESMLNFVDQWENNNLYDHSVGKKSGKSSSTISANSIALNITPSMFYEKVMLNKKNVVVMFYAEWCSHCKKHLPLFDVISKKLNQIIYTYVYVDIGDHFDENVKIEEVPSIYVYPSFNKDSPIKFEGTINAKNVVDFLKKEIEKKDDL